VNADAECAMLGGPNLHAKNHMYESRECKQTGLWETLATDLERMGASKVNACRSLPTTAPIVTRSIEGSPDRPRGDVQTSPETEVQLADEHVCSSSIAIEAVTSIAPKLSPSNDMKAPPLSGALGAAMYVTTGPSYERK
jgi:hypothetical protein